MNTIEAIKGADLVAFKKLLDQGVDVMQMDEKGYPLIYHSVSRGEEVMTRLLLERGAKLDVALPEGSMAGAAVLGNMTWALLELIERHEADLNVADRYGNAPLMYALDPEVMKILLDHGADIRTRNNRGENILHLLARFGALEIMEKAISAGVDINAKADFVGTPLLIAARSGQCAALALLLEAGARLDVVDHDGRSPVEMVRAQLAQAHENSKEADDLRKVLLVLLTTRPKTAGAERPPQRRIIRRQRTQSS